MLGAPENGSTGTVPGSEERRKPCAEGNLSIYRGSRSRIARARAALSMSYIYRIPMLPAALPLIVFAIGIGEAVASAEEAGAESRFEEHSVEFHNKAVKLAGSLLLPNSEAPVPAVVFVHGAGRHTRESLREVGEFFATNGIAALIYDKRGAGQSSGAYESHRPYENRKTRCGHKPCRRPFQGPTSRYFLIPASTPESLIPWSRALDSHDKGATTRQPCR